MREIRSYRDKVSVRADGDDEGRITGVAARYYDGTEETEFRLWDGLVERIRPGAFRDAIADGHDVRALFNHDSNLILGRTEAGTLKLREWTDGLHYSTEPADTNVYQDTVKHLRRGDVDGSSFGFRVTKVTYEETDEGQDDVRWLENVRLYDVGPVTFPAYEGASSAVRSLDDVRAAPGKLATALAEWDAWKESLRDDRAAHEKAWKDEQRHMLALLRSREVHLT